VRRITALPDHVLSFNLAGCCLLLALISGIGSTGFWILVTGAALAAMYGLRELRARRTAGF
jgi:hypothetical protein